jgi:hypothetical protein
MMNEPGDQYQNVWLDVAFIIYVVSLIIWVAC